MAKNGNNDLAKATGIWVIAMLVLTLLALLGCVRPVVSTVVPVYEAAIIVDDSLLEKAGKLAVTGCAWNNKPYIVADDSALESYEGESLIRHEQAHVRQAVAFRGGCWPFHARYVKDSAFKANVEYEAYCEQGQFLMRRNRSAEDLWERIRQTMIYRYGVANPKNCLYEEGGDFRAVPDGVSQRGRFPFGTDSNVHVLRGRNVR